MNPVSELDVAAVLQPLEESLWRSETRYDAAYMEAILAPDFVEFGCSGRIWSKSGGVPMGSEPIAVALPLPAFTVRLVGEGVALVTYVSEVQYETLQRANRSSLWVFNGVRWRLMFHQGTPVG
ncbi:MAG: DUF4440 domain-containing protein [Ilumatobacteraceae bacterium]